MNLSDSIKHLGLDPNEARVYEALLELGPSTVTEITKKANVTRTFGYELLENLGLHGLVHRVSGPGKKIRYTVEHPRRLVQYVENKSRQWERRVDDAKQLLPELISLYKLADKPTIAFQEGVEGVKSIYSQSLESKEEILSIADIEGWDVPEFRLWGQEYNRERSKRKIHERMLMLDTPKGRAWMKDYKGSFAYTHFRWIKPEQLPQISDFRGEINIFENKVIIALLKKPTLMCVLIESATLANILKSLFSLAWTQGIENKKGK